MKKKKLKIHSENILPIIKKWLYSERDIFVRELVSNSCDAIQKVKVLRERGEVEALDDEFRIDIAIDKEKRTLTFSDTGIGMDTEEVEKYIAQLAFSGAEEFVEKYQSDEEGEQIIGHFGLGFYSSYMVADTVEIQTRSYRTDAEAVHWKCDGSHNYSIGSGERSTRGTDVVLHLGSDHDEYLEEGRLREILNQYCTFLPVPIFLNGNRLNEKEPLWIKPASECDEEEYLEFYRTLYPMDEEPLFWVHLNVDYPFNLKGVLYFPRVRRDFDFSKNTIKLFCNRVFVSENCKDLIPDYLMVLRGAIDSPDIPLNVSRSYLQMDRTVRQLATHIAKKVSDRIVTLYKNDREKFLEVWTDLELIVKLGVMQDEKFYDKCKEALVWKNTKGEWTTIEEYVERNGGKVFYTGDEKQSSHFLDLYGDKEVLYTAGPVDTHIIAFLERKLDDVTFQRIDGGVDDAILDTAREKTVLDADGKTEAVRLADYVKQTLGLEGLKVEAKSLSADSIPALLVIDEAARRMRDMMAMSDSKGDMGEMFLKESRTLVVNTNNRLIEQIYQMGEKEPDLSKELLEQVYDLALLTQREIKPDRLDAFIKRHAQVLEKLAVKEPLTKS